MKRRKRQIWMDEDDIKLLKMLSAKKRKPMWKVIHEKLSEDESEKDFRFRF